MDPKPKYRRQKHCGAQCLECIDNMPCAEYKLQILQETDTCNKGKIGAILLGAILRREGLYSSHLTPWRRQRQVGQLAVSTDIKQGRKPSPENPFNNFLRFASELQNLFERLLE